MLGLYVHIPFCRSKCKYCDFVSFAGKQELQKDYIDAVMKELDTYPKETVETVFIGGGTPSFLSLPLLEKLIKAVGHHFIFNKVKEFTIEANPCDLSREKLFAYQSFGINRLSIGLQSANENELRMLGRAHTFEQFLNGYQNARDAGFSNINVDLISGLPNQTIDSFMQTLDTITLLRPEHLSCYSLIIDEHTPIAGEIKNGLLPEPDEETDRKIYAMTKTELEKAGYERYEISNYAKAGYECQHNLNYWLSGKYIGLGAAASSFYNGKRYTNLSDLYGYINMANQNESLVQNSETLTEKDLLFETIMLQLRLTRGIDRKLFKARFKNDIVYYFKEIIEKCIKNGLLVMEDSSIRLTDRGFDVADSVVLEFME